mmetsp:Transcript_3764/g.5558  ORF Transcript_3764/g.5558 Transcript_3764/m.5558 type:complete len:334 (+) Transcript_3764:1316-2317(+)
MGLSAKSKWTAHCRAKRARVPSAIRSPPVQKLSNLAPSRWARTSLQLGFHGQRVATGRSGVSAKVAFSATDTAAKAARPEIKYTRTACAARNLVAADGWSARLRKEFLSTKRKCTAVRREVLGLALLLPNLLLLLFDPSEIGSKSERKGPMRIVCRGKTELSDSAESKLLALLGDFSCRSGSNVGCNHMHYISHRGELGVKVLFPATEVGKSAADAAALSFNNQPPPRRRSRTYPAAVDPRLRARVYACNYGTTATPLPILPAGMELDAVLLEPACAETGCWVIDVTYTAGSLEYQLETFNSFFLPYAGCRTTTTTLTTPSWTASCQPSFRAA